MADALCGPSNPVQSFRKHTQVDRTLQQDRLVGPRHSPAQGFRTPDPRTGALDAEFHAFENAPVNPFQFQQPHFATPPPAFASQPPTAANWASDFQKLHISNTPIPVQQFRTEAPLIRSSSAGGWHDEFMRQRSSASTPSALGKQAIRDSPIGAYSNQMSFGGNYGQSMYQPDFMNVNTFQQPIQQQQSTQQLQHEQISDAAFEEAFSDAFAHADQLDQLKDSNQGITHTNENLQTQQDLAPEIHESDIRIGSDAINYTEVKDRTVDQDTRDADELARTAGQLLNAVQHDTSTKFQNSQFLDLMRRIRDREIEVQNNDFQERTNTTTGPQITQLGEPVLADTLQPQQQQASSKGQFQPHDPNSFQFPDMNNVYAPPENLPDHDYDFSYNTDNDQYPTSQIQALHPGGRMYPEQSSPQPGRAHMSGGVGDVDGNGSGGGSSGQGRNKLGEEFDRYDENPRFGRRYQRPSVEEANV